MEEIVETEKDLYYDAIYTKSRLSPRLRSPRFCMFPSPRTPRLGKLTPHGAMSLSKVAVLDKSARLPKIVTLDTRILGYRGLACGNGNGMGTGRA